LELKYVIKKEEQPERLGCSSFSCWFYACSL
jgi:hypothetical protein